MEKPHHFHLLGQDVVVWYDGAIGNGRFGPKKNRPRGAKRSDQGTWRAFIDECPHRKVPLSEGRVEDDGTLLCSYHAWRFDGQGQCVAVPQVESLDDLSKIQNNPRTRCNSFPTRLINGVLFVWPSADENAVLESSLTPVAHRPAESNRERLFEGTWNYRELPYGADYFIENVVDPGM
jgi:phenylpropionate dioxygenase-like ring-hydroxylating dioxygenase large terminal subunit